MGLDLIIRKANLPDGKKNVDIGVKDGVIVEIKQNILTEGIEEIIANGYLVSPPFVDSHFHMDTTLTVGNSIVNKSGTLLEGIELWGSLKPDLTIESIKKRAMQLCHWSIARGTLAIRSHVDICDDKLLAVQALVALREEMKQYIDIQLVAFPQDGYYRYPNSRNNLLRAIELGLDVVGGIPHFERTASEGTRSIKELCEIAEKHALPVDMHCDETDDPMSRHVESLVYESQRLGLNGRVTGSHLTSMHSMDNYYAKHLFSLMQETNLQVVANPLINITLQGRHDTYPKRRGMTRVKELLSNGVNVSFGHDCVMDPWYSLGSHDMLEVASMGLHVAQMTSTDQMKQIYNAVTVNGARTMELEGYGLKTGCFADLIILQANDIFEALRLRPARLYVIRRGKVISKTQPIVSLLNIDNRSIEIDYSNQLL
jgi:cytosine deaminase